MYAKRHRATGMVHYYVADEDADRLLGPSDDEFEHLYIPGDPYELWEKALPGKSPEADGAVGTSYLIDDMSNPPPECPARVLAALDATMDSPDIEHGIDGRTMRCMPVERKKPLPDALEEVLAEDRIPDAANLSVGTMRKAIARARGKTRTPGSVVPKIGSP